MKIRFSQLFKTKHETSLFTFLFIFFRAKNIRKAGYTVYDGVNPVLAMFIF